MLAGDRIKLFNLKLFGLGFFLLIVVVYLWPVLADETNRTNSRIRGRGKMGMVGLESFASSQASENHIYTFFFNGSKTLLGYFEAHKFILALRPESQPLQIWTKDSF